VLTKASPKREWDIRSEVIGLRAVLGKGYGDEGKMKSMGRGREEERGDRNVNK
jgi:hypothetical protein